MKNLNENIRIYSHQISRYYSKYLSSGKQVSKFPFGFEPVTCVNNHLDRTNAFEPMRGV